MAKTKRFMVGGIAAPNTYPFANPNTVAPDTSVKIGGRQEPLGEVMGTQEPVTMYKRGGKVKKYADGGIYTKEMGQPPMDDEVAKPSKKKPDPDAGVFTVKKLNGKKEAPRDLMPEDFKKKSKPMAKGGCAKGYADGGVTEGENANIDDDTRDRAMAAVRRRMAGEDDEAPVAVKPRSEAKMLPTASGRERVNAAPSGRGAAPGSFRKDVVKPSTEALVDQIPGGVGKYKGPVQRSESEEVGSKAMDTAKKALGPLGAGAGAAGLAVGAKKLYDRYKTGKQLAESTARGAADRARLAAKRKKQEDDYDAMRSSDMEGGYKKGGRAKAYAGGGSVKGAGVAQRGVRKCKVV